MFRRDSLICGLDIGTTKISAVLAEYNPVSEQIEYHAAVKRPSGGIKNGDVRNIDDSTNSVRETLEELEQVAGRKISECYLGIGGNHIRGLNSSGRVSIKKDGFYS